MYKLLLNDSITNQPLQSILRIADNAYIPFDPANTDYQIYLKWIEAGNTPEPAEGAE